MTNYTVFANNSQTGTQFTFAMAILADTGSNSARCPLWEAHGTVSLFTSP